MVRADAARADRARVPHAEHGRRIPRPARLEMPHQTLELRADLVQRQLEIDPLARREVLGREKLPRNAEERTAKLVEPVTPDGEAGRHRMAAVFLEVHTDAMEGAVEVKARNASSRAAPQLTARFPPDQERRPAVTLDETRSHDADHAGMPRVGGKHDGGVVRIE